MSYFQEVTLRSLLENPELLNAPKNKDNGDKKKDGDDLGDFIGASAFLGPTLWDRTLPYDGEDFKLEYMDLDEFLNENGIPTNTDDSGSNAVQGPMARPSPQQNIMEDSNSSLHGVCLSNAQQASPSSSHLGSPVTPGSPQNSEPLGSPRSQQIGSPQSQHLGSPRSQHLGSPQSPHLGSPQSSHLGSPQSPHVGSPQSPLLRSPSPLGSPGSACPLGTEVASPAESVDDDDDDAPSTAMLPAKRSKSAHRKVNEVASRVKDTNWMRQDVVTAIVPGQEGFDPCSRAFSEEELKPQPMIKKSKKVFVPEDMKDDKYWCRRKKNNVAAKRSRDARRVKENQIAMRAGYLEKQNNDLRAALKDSLAENKELMKRLAKYEGKA